MLVVENISTNFKRSEFACECGCGFDTVDKGLIDLLEEIRLHYSVIHDKVKVVVTGGNRCIPHNEKIQKKYTKNYIPFSSKSTHIEAKAGDIKIYYYDGNSWIAISSNDMYKYFDENYPNNLGLGWYHNRIHIDSRDKKARWGKK